MHTVLVVEDEPKLRVEMVRRLTQIGALDVESAGRVAEARDFIEQERPQLLIADLTLPDGSALVLLDEIERLRINCPAILLSSNMQRDRPLVPAEHDVLLMEKPVTLETLVALAIDRLRTHSSDPKVSHFVELARSGGYASIIEVTRGGHPLGEVIVKGGEVWSARSAHCRGQDAIARLDTERGAQVSVRPLEPDETKPPGV